MQENTAIYLLTLNRSQNDFLGILHIFSLVCFHRKDSTFHKADPVKVAKRGLQYFENVGTQKYSRFYQFDSEKTSRKKHKKN